MTSERASESGGQECRSWNRERSWHCVGFVNRGSGGQLGARVFQAAQDSGLDEVHDLCADGPRNVLLRLATTEDTAHGVLILAFGGDGTFNWLASTVMELRAGGHARFQPHIIPCPLGTGNDLSRVLGWGSSFPGLDALPRWVSLALKAPLGPQLDIWGVQFTKTSAKLSRMQNYFSVGVDAEVALRFDAARAAAPEKFKSAVSNKIKYATLGADLAVTGAASLEKRMVALKIDGVAVALAEGTKAIVCLNISSYGAGGHPWGDDVRSEGGSGCSLLPKAHSKRVFLQPAVDDGVLEVVALSGIAQAAMMHVPVSVSQLRGYGGKRLGQGRRVEFVFKSEEQYEKDNPDSKSASRRPLLAAQVDGEAWSFPCYGETIAVSLCGEVGAPRGPTHRASRGWPHARSDPRAELAIDTVGEAQGVLKEPAV